VKKLFMIIVIVGMAALVVSCMTFFATTLSDEAQKANISIATNPGVVANLKFVNGWTADFGSAYDAQKVGVLTANDMASKGWRDVCVLVELVSRGNANASTYDIEAHLNMWQISIFRTQESQGQTAAPPRHSEGILDVVTYGTPSQVRAAIRSGADIGARDRNGGTPLMLAAIDNPDAEVITTLLEAGADINAHDKNGMTPLMYAARFNFNPDVLTTLIKAGADAKAKDNGGMMAFDYAENNAKLKGTDAYQQLEEASQ
jgi:hypothetical protein